MKLSRKSRYGLTALVDLAANSKSGHLSLANIAERNQISPLYLEQVFASLRKGGIVKSIKGPQGGYLLKQNPEDISISAVLDILEGTYHIADEDNMENPISRSIQKVVIDRVNDELDNILQNLTLADLETFYSEQTAVTDMYYI